MMFVQVEDRFYSCDKRPHNSFQSPLLYTTYKPVIDLIGEPCSADFPIR
jgi:hypothetical protein